MNLGYKLAFICFFIALSAHAQPPIIKKVEAYTKELADAKLQSENLTNNKYFEKTFKFFDKTTKKEVKFSQLSAFDQKMYQLNNSKKFNDQLYDLNEEWLHSMKYMKERSFPDSKGKTAETIGPDDMSKMLKELLIIRTSVVKTWEKQAESIFKEFPKEFDEKEKIFYLKTIRNSLK